MAVKKFLADDRGHRNWRYRPRSARGLPVCPGQVTVPNLRGKSLAEATAQPWRPSHLKVGQTTTREEPTKTPNVVISQYPPSEEQVKRGTAMDLVVSAAVTQVEVPAVTGQSLEAAQRRSAEHHLMVGDVSGNPAPA